MLHQRRRHLCSQNMGIAGVLFTPVTGIGTAVVLQNLFFLRDNDQFPANQLFTNEPECTTTLAAGQLGFRQLQHDLFYRQVFRQFVNRTLFLPGVALYRKGFLGRFFCFGVLHQFRFMKQTHLVFAQNIGLLLTGLSETGTLGIEQDLIHMIQFLFQGSDLGLLLPDRCLEFCHFGSSICFFLLCRHDDSPSKTTLSQVYYTITLR